MGIAFLRDMNWLGANRVRSYLRILALGNIAMIAIVVATSHGGLDANGFLLGTDFISFWTTGQMLHAGGNPYDAAAHISAQRVLYASPGHFTAFFYPPSFLPFCWPLGGLGYFPALGIWLGATGSLFIVALREWRFEAGKAVPFWLALVAYPAMAIVLTHGQTSWLVAALLGTGLLQVRKRPVLAGICLGLATVKPQFGVLVPIALLASREWKVVVVASVTAIALAAFSAVIFGAQVWSDWFAATARAQAAMHDGAVGFGKMVSLFAGLRLLGVSGALASSAQGALSVGVAALVLRTAWNRRWDRGLAALVLAGAPLVTPFVLDYDMVLLAFPILWLAGEGLHHGFWRWEKLTLFTVFAATAFARPLALHVSIPIMPLVLAGFFAAIWSRATERGRVHCET
ncbi:glycosyltransferase family 87 protein [Novosphingobium mangrovi (ex Hu et al. 2023)]|uniref:DUF2029 domain-containing protein n=1 Tax=Novosphingobium mangrovi (ex Hu et al. 2023) TaxID=2930094 RepID=A0ABT0A9F9_9SPHN|nr:glycosyltransferase family 87 protein [Novosphingobium mangrovi (ex Hu et al. 2023)]MCJ1959843.1 DUF2029 domain-containing protein [Novosphingobium mangrovi (ex Hu et al. 2023)]